MNNDFTESTYRSLMNFTLELYQLEDMRKVLSLIVEKTVQLMNADRCTLYLFDKKTDELVSEFYHGAPKKKIRVPLGDTSIAGYCGIHKKIININDVYGDITKTYKGLKFNKIFDEINQYETKSILCIPLLDSKDRLLGVISMLNSLSASGFSKKDESLLKTISHHAVISVSRLQRQELSTIFSEQEQKRFTGSQELFIIFFDIIDYTRLSESQGDEKIKKIIQAWEEDHIRLINDYGGIYVKSAGDEIMSLFGFDPTFIEQPPDTDSFNLQFDKNLTLDEIIRVKNSISNHTNLKLFIPQFTHWLDSKKGTLDKNTLNKAKRFKRSLWAQNVIKFMYMAQKNMNKLNNFFFENNILTQEKLHRVFMKGGAEFGPVIVGFDFYGRIDVIGDIVNVAARITDKGNKYTIGASIVEQPLLIGPNLNNLLPKKGFVNKTKNYLRLKGKEKPIYIYSIDSIDSLENRSFIPSSSFLCHKKFVLKQINGLDKVEQTTLPFNYASYKIENNDKYLVDHSKRVAINSLHIIDLLNKMTPDRQSITPDQKKTITITALLHDIGRHSLNDQVKAYIDPTKSIRAINEEEKEVFSRLTSSFGNSILESITQLRPFAHYVKCCGLHYNGYYQYQSYADNPSKENLPVESRIVTVANAIDSILSDAPFKEKLDIENLIDIFKTDIKQPKGQAQVQKFDPAILSVVIEYYQQVLLSGSNIVLK